LPLYWLQRFIIATVDFGSHMVALFRAGDASTLLITKICAAVMLSGSVPGSVVVCLLTL
jgi:hypothetical protein